MKRDCKVKNYLIPLISYVLLISAILFIKILAPWEYAISVSAVLMLSIPLILESDMNDLRWDPKGLLLGIAVSAVLLLIYFAVLWAYGRYTGGSLAFNKLSYSFVLMQLLLVALPEEFFFRGYLQYRLGNNIKGIIVVSILFAAGHFLTLCVWGLHSLDVCSQSVLTFFPSLVMGYLYYKTGTLWASILFHFLANLTYVAAAVR